MKCHLWWVWAPCFSSSQLIISQHSLLPRPILPSSPYSAELEMPLSSFLQLLDLKTHPNGPHYYHSNSLHCDVILAVFSLPRLLTYSSLELTPSPSFSSHFLYQICLFCLFSNDFILSTSFHPLMRYFNSFSNLTSQT